VINPLPNLNPPGVIPQPNPNPPVGQPSTPPAAGSGALDKLDPEKIPAPDRKPNLKELVAVLKGHTDEVWSCAFTPDGKTLITGGKDGTVRLWDVTGAEPREQAILRDHKGPVGGIAISRDGKILGTVSGDNTARFWDLTVNPPRFRGSVLARGSLSGCVALSPDCRTAAVSEGPQVHLVEWIEGGLLDRGLLPGHEGPVNGLAFSPDGRTLATSSSDKSVQLWDLTRTPPGRWVIKGFTGATTAMAWTPDSKGLVVGCTDGTLRILDLSDNAPRMRATIKGLSEGANSVSFAPDGTTFFITGVGATPGGQTAVWWNTADLGKRQDWTLPGRWSCCAFAPDGRHVALANHDRNVYILRLNVSGGVTVRPPTPAPITPTVPVRPPTTVPAAPTRTAVPGSPEQDAAEKKIKAAFELEYTKTRPTEKLELANKLLETGVKTRDNPAERFVLLREAREMAVQAGDALTALRSIDEMAQAFSVDGMDLKVQTLTRMGQAATTPAANKALTESILLVIDETVAHDQFETARALLTLGEATAHKTTTSALVVRIQNRAREVGELQKEHETMQAAAAHLKDKPDDAEANLTVGRYLCLRKGDWDKGLLHLAKSSEAALADQARKDLAGTVGGVEAVAVGDGWWQLADASAGATKAAYHARAATWYRRALPKLTGVDQTRAEKRIALVEEQTRTTLPDVVGPLQRFVGHTDVVNSVALSRDGHYALSGSADGSVRLWDVATGKLVRSLATNLGDVRAVRFNTSGSWAIAASTNELGLWEVATGNRLNPSRKLFPWETALLSPRGKLAWTGGGRGSLSEIRLDDNGFNPGSFSNPNYGTVRLLALSPGDRIALFVSSSDEGVHLYDLEQKKDLAVLPRTVGAVRCAAFSPTGDLFAVAGEENVILVLNAVTLRPISLKGHTGRVISLAFAPDGKRLLSGSTDRSVRLWDLKSKQLLQRFDHTDAVTSVTFSADGRRALSGSADKTMRLWGLPK
jgi:WD40 repeat protein